MKKNHRYRQHRNQIETNWSGWKNESDRFKHFILCSMNKKNQTHERRDHFNIPLQKPKSSEMIVFGHLLFETNSEWKFEQHSSKQYHRIITKLPITENWTLHSRLTEILIFNQLRMNADRMNKVNNIKFIYQRLFHFVYIFILQIFCFLCCLFGAIAEYCWFSIDILSSFVTMEVYLLFHCVLFFFVIISITIIIGMHIYRHMCIYIFPLIVIAIQSKSRYNCYWAIIIIQQKTEQTR